MIWVYIIYVLGFLNVLWLLLGASNSEELDSNALGVAIGIFLFSPISVYLTVLYLAPGIEHYHPNSIVANFLRTYTFTWED